MVATQNPVEYEGTYPLPEAQLDRFMVRVSLGYPSADQEAAMLLEHAESDRVLDLEPVADVAEILAAQAAAAAVHGSEALRRYVVSILEATRADSRVELGASPRAGLMLFRAAKANAALDGRDHALPDDVQELADGRADAPAAARARRRATRSATPSCATPWSGSRRSDRGAAPTRHGAARIGAVPGRGHSTRPRCTSRASADARAPAVAVAWVLLAAKGATIKRTPGRPRSSRRSPYPLRIEVRSGIAPPPGRRAARAAAGWPVPIAGRWSRRLRINVRFSRRGRRELEPARLVIRDPLRLFSRELERRRRRRRCSCCRASSR